MKASLVSTTVALAALVITPSAVADPAKPEIREKTIIKIVKSGEAGTEVSDADVDAAIEKCRKGARKVDTANEIKGKDGKTRNTRVIICSDGDSKASQAQMLSALEKARERLASIDALSPEAKAKALAGIDEQLNRLKSQAPSGE